MLLLISSLFLWSLGTGTAESCDSDQMKETFFECLQFSNQIISNGTFEDYCSHSDLLQDAQDCLMTTAMACNDESGFNPTSVLMLGVMQDVSTFLHSLLCDKDHTCSVVGLIECLPSIRDLQELAGMMTQNNFTGISQNLCQDQYYSRLIAFHKCWTPSVESSLSCFAESPEKMSLGILSFRVLHTTVSFVQDSLPTMCSPACLMNFETMVDEIMACSLNFWSNLAINETDIASQCELVENISLCIKNSVSANRCQPLWENLLLSARNIYEVQKFLTKCSGYIRAESGIFDMREKTTLPEQFGMLTNRPQDQMLRTASMKPKDKVDKGQFIFKTTLGPDDIERNLIGSGAVPTLAPGLAPPTSASPDDIELTLSIVLSAVILAVVVASGI